MSELSRKDLFYIGFPKKFISEQIEGFYQPYVKRMPTYVDSPRELVKSTVQAITIPSFGYPVVEQNYKDKYFPSAITRQNRSSLNPQDLSDKSLTITFKMINGYVNYWIMLDAFFEHYDYSNENPYMFDLPVHIMDNDGTIMFSRVFKDCIFSAISEFQISYSDNIAGFDTFDVTFNYTTSEMKFLEG